MTDYIDTAFREVDRAEFVLPKYRDAADQDRPLPIGFGQTISQPSTVRAMLEWLNPRPGQHILDVGSGSGWTSALLADIVGKHGHVYATEVLPELLTMGRENCERLGLGNISFHYPGPAGGLAESAPYDRILVSAAARGVPLDLQQQVKPGGKLVVPVESSIIELTNTDGKWELVEHAGFAFVPLIDSSL